MNERRTDPAVMGYAGCVNPAEAYAELQADPLAVLVDVRTSAEWSYVGLPDLTAVGKRVIFCEWQHFPGRRSERAVRRAATPDRSQ